MHYKHSHRQTLSAANLPEEAGVYEVVCLPTGERYIGGTSNFKTRVRMHRHRARSLKHTPRFNAAWAKHGEHAFRMRVIEVTLDFGEREVYHIAKARANGEVLLNSDGDTGGKGCSTPASRKRRQQAETDGFNSREAHRKMVIDIFTSHLPSKHFEEKYGISHASVSLIRGGKRNARVLREAGLL